MLAIELAHAIRVEEDQRDEYVNRTLIREPEAELVSANTYRIQVLTEFKTSTRMIPNRNETTNQMERHNAISRMLACQ
jgi:hypothetical protein